MLCMVHHGESFSPLTPNWKNAIVRIHKKDFDWIRGILQSSPQENRTFISENICWIGCAGLKNKEIALEINKFIIKK